MHFADIAIVPLLKLCAYAAVMVGWVYLVGLMFSGGRPARAWEYTRRWLGIVGGMAAVGAVAGCVLLVVTSSPS